MSDEESAQKSGSSWNPKARKRKKWVGTAYDEDLQEKAEALRPQLDSGYYCKAEGKWVRFKDVVYNYVVTGEKIEREIFCKPCGSLIKTEVIG